MHEVEYLDFGSVALRPAVASDAETLSRFAARMFEETFGPSNSASDMEAYLRASYSPAIQAAEIADPANSITLAMHGRTSRKTLVGYAHTTVDRLAHSVQLKRLYIDSDWHGHGLANRLMSAILNECVRDGVERLWLTVWEQNPRAIAFYKKAGFHICGETAFRVGDDVQTDLVMETAPMRRDALA